MTAKFVITVIAQSPDADSEAVATFGSNFVTKTLNIDAYTTQVLGQRAIDYYFDTTNPEQIHKTIKDQIPIESYDVIFQEVDQRKSKKLFIFDMDSTLIYQEVIELIAAYADIEDKVAEITTRAMNGELDFNASLHERVQLLKGIDASTLWDELKHKIVITKGVKELTKALLKLGIITGVCSGGFIPLAEHVKTQLGLNYAYANTLGIDKDMKLDGTTIGPIVNGDKKAELLLEIAKNHNIDPKDAVAVGDGANDLKMMGLAGFGIAWNAKPKVQQVAPCCLNSDTLQDVLYIIGYNDEEIVKLVQ
jgi:phosphoserine phosphatase